MIDLLVAGAGPTGLTAAIAAASRGLQVVVLDPHKGILDKACGEGLMPATVAALTELGVELQGRPFHGIRYLRPGCTATGRFAVPALGVRRTHLHAALTQRAEALGVRRIAGRVDTVESSDHAVRAAGLQARWMIAADGLRSPTRRALGLDRPSSLPPRFGLRQHWQVPAWSDTVDVHWGVDAEAYVTPVADDLVGIAFLFGASAQRADRGEPGRPIDRMLARFPMLAERIAGAPVASQPRGAGPFAVGSTRRVAGRVLLVGDAAGFVDPITGEGIKLGVLGARRAVDAIVTQRPQDWERSWRQLWRPYAWSTKGLLRITRSPSLRTALPAILRAAPPIFDGALSVLAA